MGSKSFVDGGAIIFAQCSLKFHGNFDDFYCFTFGVNMALEKIGI
jgi:hypothetical protein